MDAKHKCIHLPEESRSDHVLMLSAFSLTKAMAMTASSPGAGPTATTGRFVSTRHTCASASSSLFVAGLELAFLGKARTSHGVTATLTGRLELGHESCGLELLEEKKPLSATFHDPSSQTLLTYIGSWWATDEQFLRQPSPLYVEFTITVLRAETMDAGDHHQMSSSDLHRHLGELLQSAAGADVTFAVSGESFAAHKSILAARLPVFKAEFFGEMQESSSSSSLQRVVVEVRDMEADVFRVLLAFVYTDTVPELDRPQGGRAETAVMAQHLLVAADRYGLDRLKAIYERRLSVCIEAGTVVTTLALAEQHNCSQLKADCWE